MGFTYAANLIAENERFVALFQAPGSPGKRRAGTRIGPRGRNLAPEAWEGRHEDFIWPGPGMLRLHPVGEHFSVLRRFDPEGGCYRGWYVNLERSWRPTPVGFDSRDDVLDLVVADDLSGSRLKDEDEFLWSIETGKFSEAEADDIRLAATTAAARVERRDFPFTDDAYRGLEPNPSWTLPRMPPTWADPFDADEEATAGTGVP